MNTNILLKSGRVFEPSVLQKHINPINRCFCHPLGIMAMVLLISMLPLQAHITLADRDTLLGQRAGFGRTATGGYSGALYHVTTNADSGPGSLRDGCTGSSPRWIVFDGDYTITLKSGIYVGSNKTIDGRGRKVKLTGHNQYGLKLDSVSNVIIENLILTDFGDITRTHLNDPFDAIQIYKSHNVWVDHCDLSVAGDKLISIGSGSTNVTVSWCHFHDQEQVFQIGSMSGASLDVNQTVTVHHNFFNRTGYRNPVVSYGKLHSYNNYIYCWLVYGMRSEHIAQTYLEANIFEAGLNVRATLYKPAGDGWNDHHTLQDTRPGFINAIGNLALNGAKIVANEPQSVFNPRNYYSYTAEPATKVLANKISSQAGWRSITFDSPGTGPTPPPPLPPTTYGNLIKEGGFEQQSAEWIGWEPAITLDSRNAYVGAQALRMDTLNDQRTLRQFVMVIPGKQYSVSAYMKGLNLTNGANIRLQFFDAKGLRIGSGVVTTVLKGTFDYKNVSVTTVAPPNAAVLRVRLVGAAGSGIVWFDNVMAIQQ